MNELMSRGVSGSSWKSKEEDLVAETGQQGNNFQVIWCDVDATLLLRACDLLLPYRTVQCGMFTGKSRVCRVRF